MSDILTIDGVSARSPVFGVSTRTGRYNVPARRGENVVLPGRSGSLWTPNKPFEEGVGALAVWVVGARHANGEIIPPASVSEARWFFEKNMNEVMRFFTQPHRLSILRAAQPINPDAPNDPPKVRVTAVEWREWGEPEVTAGGTRAEWAIAYTIPSTWWVDEQETSFSRQGPGTLAFESLAGMTGIIEDPFTVVTGPAVAPKIVCPETGGFVQWTGTLGEGQQWITTAVGQSAVNGLSVLPQTIHSGSGYRFLTLPNRSAAGPYPTVNLEATGTNQNTALTINVRGKWVSG